MLSNHPANLLLRFFLEIVALVVVGQWGWQRADGLGRYLLAFGLPVLMAALWATFSVPGDRPKPPLVTVSGPVRLALEALFFGFAVVAAFANGSRAFGLALIVALALHYIWSMDRVVRLLKS